MTPGQIYMALWQPIDPAGAELRQFEIYVPDGFLDDGGSK
jgi:hypothetical protein